MKLVLNPHVPRLMGAVYFARTWAKSGGTVHLQYYKSMPHTFVMFERHPSTETCYQSLAAFANGCVAGKVETKMERIDGRGVISGAFDAKGFPEYSKDEVCIPFRFCSKGQVDFADGRGSREETVTTSRNSMREVLGRFWMYIYIPRVSIY
jgi:hypothetical protein